MKSKIALWVGLLVSPLAMGQEVSFDSYVDQLKTEAIEQGVSANIVESAFKNVQFKKKAVVADKNQPEKKITLDEYIPRAVPKWKVDQAKSLYKKHRVELERIGKEFGVQPRFIVALWGVESNFGHLTGGYHVINALTTLAYEGRREAFFRKELFAALNILDEGHISVDAMKGSWAGAMGQCQFMPTSFLAYAVDGNGDGKKDIWNNTTDVFASTANYLSHFGWDDKYTWGREVTLTKPLNDELLGRQAEKAQSLTEWSKLGVVNKNGQALPKLNTEIEAWLIAPDDQGGRTYLVYENYQILMRWNRSYYFGLAVSHLADALKDID
jgi:membrane-bound lytic murein transglycosylase B